MPSDRCGAATLRVGTSAGSTRVTASLGVLQEIRGRVRLSLVVTDGASWKAERTAVTPRWGRSSTECE